MTGGVVSGRRQMGGLTADQSTAHRHQGVEMLCALAGWTRLVALQQGLCDGTIPARRVALMHTIHLCIAYIHYEVVL